MNQLKLYATIILIVVSSFALSAKSVLFKNGKTNYAIVVSYNASVSEKTAAKELQTYLKQISGADFPIQTSPAKKNIFIGKNDCSTLLSGLSLEEYAADDEGFTCKSIGENIFINGGSKRGTMYGVYSFLEKFLDVRWFTTDFTLVPEKKSFTFDSFAYSETPAIKYRFDQYYAVEKDHVWCAHNRNNHLWRVSNNEYGGIEAYWNAHTFGQIVNAKKYFGEHPEYFSLIRGKREPASQLCLTNPEVLQICIEGMKKAIADNPDYWVYSLSQNDNELPCECDECKALEAKYGGHSGAILWFVNQVADAIKPIYPDKYIGTFAYRYTRHAPVGIEPRDNMVIRLCSIECCFGHSIENCPENQAFVSDLKKWSEIAPKLFIWDYVVNFYQYLAPFPNFQVLADNIKTFQKYNAVGIQEEAQYQTDGGEFAEMKAWVLAKLLWNPNQDWKALVHEFIEAYYGDAAPYIQNYFDLCQTLVKEDTHFDIYINPWNPLFNDDFVTKAMGILQMASWAVADNPVLAQRVETVSLQPLFLKVRRHLEESGCDGTYSKFVEIVKRRGFRVNEGVPAEICTDFIGRPSFVR